MHLPPRVTCEVCKRTFPKREFYDLTINAGSDGVRVPGACGTLSAYFSSYSGEPQMADPFPHPPSQGTFKEQVKTSQTLFESPLISFVYERGWRQGAWVFVFHFPGGPRKAEPVTTLHSRSRRSREQLSDRSNRHAFIRPSPLTLRQQQSEIIKASVLPPPLPPPPLA